MEGDLLTGCDCMLCTRLISSDCTIEGDLLTGWLHDINRFHCNTDKTTLQYIRTWKLMGGGGLRGSIRTTLDSTLGGGLKLFLPTYGRERWLRSQNYSQIKLALKDRKLHGFVCMVCWLHTITYIYLVTNEQWKLLRPPLATLFSSVRRYLFLPSWDGLL